VLGSTKVVEALTAMARQAGVEFVFRTGVKQIEVKSGRARGVVLADGQRVEADTIVANADLPYVYQHLLPPDGQAKRLARKRFSCSVVSFFWGVDKQIEG
jgi:phytoene dehydrogenase-like protein